jgi:hypothetical protein
VPETNSQVDIGYHYYVVLPPVASNDSNEWAHVCENVNVDDIDLTAYSSDTNGLPLTYSVTSPSYGTLTMTSPGHFTYLPDYSSFTCSDSFTYKANNGYLDSGTATVTITNRNQFMPLTSDVQTCANTPAGITLEASDNCYPGDVSTYQYKVVTNTVYGTLSGTPPSLTYSNASPTFTGMDSFTYMVSNSCGQFALQTVHITVGDSSITANAQSVATGTNTSASITLTINTICSDTISYAIVAGPTNGTLSGTGATRTYAPNSNYEGIDHFDFAVSDGVWSSTNTVTIYVVAGPTNLTAQCAANGVGVTLNWSLDATVQQMEDEDDLHVDNFNFYRSTTLGGPYSKIDSADASQTSYQDLTAIPGTNYYYKVAFGYNLGTSVEYETTNSTAVVDITVCYPSCSGTNLWVDWMVTPQQMAQWIVGTSNVTVANATFTGTNLARGTFGNGSGAGLTSMDSGIILSSGNIATAVGTNNVPNAGTAFGFNREGLPGDADLSNLVGGGTTKDAAVLEFDVVSTNSFTLQFQYIFASEEYPEWIGSYNDPMAIFVTTNRVGTDWINSINNDLALVPGTTNVPVSVNTINGGCTSDVNNNYDSPSNPQYYVDNYDPHFSAISPYAAAFPIYNIQYDGFTTLLTNSVTISANVTNHIKIAIADYGDPNLDSAVFIKATIPCPF